MSVNIQLQTCLETIDRYMLILDKAIIKLIKWKSMKRIGKKTEALKTKNVASSIKKQVLSGRYSFKKA